MLHKPNGGISSARNCGLRVATGAVIALLDSDDLWSPAYLATQMRIVERRPEIDVVTGNAWFLGGPLTGRPARPVPDPRPAPDLSRIIADETARAIVADCFPGRDIVQIEALDIVQGGGGIHCITQQEPMP